MPTKTKKSVEHKNFYETIEEARMRLNDTVVMYDKLPYYVLAVENHKADGIFRVYLDPLSTEQELYSRRKETPLIQYSAIERAEKMDTWLDTAEGRRSGILRKMANSPLFNKFRPFPLGMVNRPSGKGVEYARRAPTRHTQQGLTQSMVNATMISLSGGPSGTSPYRSTQIGYTNPCYAECILGDYPAYQEVLTNLKDPEVANEACAFHREFALLRGPLSLLFLAYKEDVVGLVSGSTGNTLRLSSEFVHVKEVCESLGIFNTITVE